MELVDLHMVPNFSTSGLQPQFLYLSMNATVGIICNDLMPSVYIGTKVNGLCLLFADKKLWNLMGRCALESTGH